jgi:hypothetical protein
MVALLCLLLLPVEGDRTLPHDRLGKDRLAAEVTTYIGAIYIWGNLYTDPLEILETIQICPAQLFNHEEIRAAEERLLRAYADRFAWTLGHRPRIRLGELAGEGNVRFRELRVEFYELKRR